MQWRVQIWAIWMRWSTREYDWIIHFGKSFPILIFSCVFHQTFCSCIRGCSKTTSGQQNALREERRWLMIAFMQWLRAITYGISKRVCPLSHSGPALNTRTWKRSFLAFLQVLWSPALYVFVLLSTSSNMPILSHTQWILSTNSILPGLCFTLISNTSSIRVFIKILMTSISQNYILRVITLNPSFPLALQMDTALKVPSSFTSIKQMTKWLEHQESCFQFASYLSWTVPGYMAELTSVAEVKADDDEMDEGPGFEVQEDDTEQTNHLSYSVVKVPAHGSIPTASLVADYHFLPNFTQLLKLSPNTSHSAKAPTVTLTLPVYKCVMVQLSAAPQVTTSVTKDIIRACPDTPAWGLTSAVPDQFYTMLARESDPEKPTVRHPLQGEHHSEPTSHLRHVFWPLDHSRLNSWSSASYILHSRRVWFIFMNPLPMLNGSHDSENQFLTLGCIKSQGLPTIIIGMHLSFLSVKLNIVCILFQSLGVLWTGHGP